MGMTADKYEWDHLVQEDRIHRRVYAESDIFALEMERIYGGTWVYIAHETEVPQPGDFKLGKLGLRPVIVTRDAASDIHVMFNRCAHRGATVCRETSGNASVFTCPYHGWKFRNNGASLAVPGKDAYANAADKDAYALARPAKVECYRGFIFATMNPQAPSLLEHLGPAAKALDEWLDQGDPEGIRVHNSAQHFRVACNWKFIYDNAGDGYHVPFSHRSLLQMTAARYGGGDMEYFGQADHSAMRSYALGNGHTLIDQRKELYKVNAWDQQRPQPGREAFERTAPEGADSRERIDYLEKAIGSGMNLSIFPNLLLIGNQIQVIEPVDVGTTVLRWYATSLASGSEELNAIRMRTQEDFPVMGEVDDNVNFEACHFGVATVPEDEWIDMSRHADTPVHVDPETGVQDGPVTSDLHMRAYFGQWRNWMAAPAQLMAVKEVRCAKR